MVSFDQMTKSTGFLSVFFRKMQFSGRLFLVLFAGFSIVGVGAAATTTFDPVATLAAVQAPSSSNMMAPVVAFNALTPIIGSAAYTAAQGALTALQTAIAPYANNTNSTISTAYTAANTALTGYITQFNACPDVRAQQTAMATATTAIITGLNAMIAAANAAIATAITTAKQAADAAMATLNPLMSAAATALTAAQAVFSGLSTQITPTVSITWPAAPASAGTTGSTGTTGS